MKLICMNHYQREIFNFSPKPVIKLDSAKPVNTHDALEKADKAKAMSTLEQADREDEDRYLNEVFHKAD